MAAGKDPNAVRARQLLKRRDVDGAVRLLQETLTGDTATCEAAELLGVILFRLKRHSEARDVFQLWTRLDPRDPAAWVNLGAALNVLGEHRAAADALRKAIQRDRKNAAAYYNLGIAEKALGHASNAVVAYTECLKIEPDSQEAAINLGNLLISQKQFSRAEKVLRAALEHAPKSAKLQRLLQKAEAGAAGTRVEISPFGRLVDEKELARRQTTVRKRELTAAQRNHERQFMREAVRELRHAIRPVVTLLDEDLPRHMHTLQMSVFQQDARYDSFSAYEGLCAAMKELDAAFETISSGIAEIRSELSKTDPGL